MGAPHTPSGVDRIPATGGGDHVKVDFDLSQDAQGYPPTTTETLWAVRVGPDQFRLDNIPFFVCGVSCFDVIEAREGQAGRWKYRRLLRPSGHSTLRVVFFDRETNGPSLEERVRELLNNLRGLGCSTEISHIPGLISVDVPPGGTLTHVRPILETGMVRGQWDYEEATLGESIQ